MTMIQARPRHGLAVAGFVCGLIGVLAGFTFVGWFLALPLGVLGIVFGVLARGWGLATAGLVLGIVAVVLSVIGLIVLVLLVSSTTPSTVYPTDVPSIELGT